MQILVVINIMTFHDPDKVMQVLLGSCLTLSEDSINFVDSFVRGRNFEQQGGDSADIAIERFLLSLDKLIDGLNI